jgi:hypothetical protein
VLLHLALGKSLRAARSVETSFQVVLKPDFGGNSVFLRRRFNSQDCPFGAKHYGSCWIARRNVKGKTDGRAYFNRLFSEK